MIWVIMIMNAFYRSYYKLLIRLFIRAYRDKVYDFIDYNDYIRSFIKGFLGKRQKNHAEK